MNVPERLKTKSKSTFTELGKLIDTVTGRGLQFIFYNHHHHPPPTLKPLTYQFMMYYNYYRNFLNHKMGTSLFVSTEVPASQAQETSDSDNNYLWNFLMKETLQKS